MADPFPLDQALAEGAATLHEAQGRTGDLPAAIRPVLSGMRLAAPAFPIQTRPGHNLAIHRGLAAAPAGSVLVVATGGPEGYGWGYWGDILTAAALRRGMAGLVIDGCVRDLDAIGRSGFAVFARGTAIRGTGKQPEGSIGDPVTIGNAFVRAGDLVVGDADGVVVVPREQRTETLAAAQARTAKERDVLDAIRAGRSTLEIYGWA